MKQAASRPRPPLPSAASGSQLAQLGEADAEIAERGLEHRQQAHIVQRVGEQPADQEFEREVIDPLAAGVVALLLRRQPAVHDAVAQRQRRGLVPVALWSPCRRPCRWQARSLARIAPLISASASSSTGWPGAG